MEINIDELQVLKQISKLNRDNGAYFTDTSRADEICRLLEATPYRQLNTEGLFYLFSRIPLAELPQNVLVISTHIDCVAGFSHCFTQELPGGILLGTFDNMMTNAAVLTLMLREALPDNVLIAFTGDEEDESRGARQVCDFLRGSGVAFAAVILDVTDMGVNEADVTVENNFWEDSFGRTVVDAVARVTDRWRFVPEDPDDLPAYLPADHIIPTEAEPDESWEYDDRNIQCFSLCIPVSGNMHGSEGVRVPASSYREYIRALSAVAAALSDNLYRS